MPTHLQEAVAGAGALGLVGGAFWYASAWPQSQIFGQTLVAGRDPREVALTFDDGPNDAATPELLDVLARHGVRATFFAVGDYVRRLPELARRIVAEGHVLGNHTMGHPRLTLLAAAKVRQQIGGCNAAIEEVTGVPVRFFRPPFGARRPLVLHAAREVGLTPVMWNVTGYDWNRIGAESVVENLDAGIVVNRRRNRGSNLLLHDGGHLAMGAARGDTVGAVDKLLTVHRGTGTRFVTVDAWVVAG